MTERDGDVKSRGGRSEVAMKDQMVGDGEGRKIEPE
jgi:hypothetical protein